MLARSIMQERTARLGAGLRIAAALWVKPTRGGLAPCERRTARDLIGDHAAQSAACEVSREFDSMTDVVVVLISVALFAGTGALVHLFDRM
jgi:hypothetical protein